MADIKSIYDRLHDSVDYKPSSANVFADWSLQAGDIISMKKDGVRHSVPVFKQTMTWKGSPVVSIESTGNKEREPVSRVSKRKYNGGGGGISSKQTVFQNIDQIEGRFEQYIRKDDSDTMSQIIQTNEYIKSIVKKVDDVNDVIEGSAIFQKKDEILDVVGKFSTDDDGNLVIDSGSGLRIKENGVEIGYYKQGSIDAGFIIQKINGNGSSSAKIIADKIELDGETIANYLNSEQLKCAKLESEDLIVGQELNVLRDITIGNQSLKQSVVQIRVDSQLSTDQRTVLVVKNADGSDYTLDFNRASISTIDNGSWDGGIFTVTATQNGDKIRKTTRITQVRVDTNSARYEPTSKRIYFSPRVMSNLGDTGYEGNPSYVDVTDAFADGRDEGYEMCKERVEVAYSKEPIDGNISLGYGESVTVETKVQILGSTDRQTLETATIKAPSKSYPLIGGSWSNGAYTVTSSVTPLASSTLTTTIFASSPTWDGNKATIKINAGSPQYPTYTGYPVTVDAKARYDAGFADFPKAVNRVYLYGGQPQYKYASNGYDIQEARLNKIGVRLYQGDTLLDWWGGDWTDNWLSTSSTNIWKDGFAKGLIAYPKKVTKVSTWGGVPYYRYSSDGKLLEARINDIGVSLYDKDGKLLGSWQTGMSDNWLGSAPLEVWKEGYAKGVASVPSATHNITLSTTFAGTTQDVSAYSNFPTVSHTGPGYYLYTFKCGTSTKRYKISVNG